MLFSYSTDSQYLDAFSLQQLLRLMSWPFFIPLLNLACNLCWKCVRDAFCGSSYDLKSLAIVQNPKAHSKVKMSRHTQLCTDWNFTKHHLKPFLIVTYFSKIVQRFYQCTTLCCLWGNIFAVKKKSRNEQNINKWNKKLLFTQIER